MSPIILFCEDPLSPRKPDMMYETEVKACESLGIQYEVISFEALVHEKRPEKAVRYVAEQSSAQVGVYRGWMLRPEYYASLFNALLAKGISLINPPQSYKHTHHLPESYSLIAPLTPETVWTDANKNISIDEIMSLLIPFGSSPAIVKDYVKSQKHYWEEACFIPSASDRQAVERVVNRFLELQGDDLNEGLVFRRFVELEPLATHSKSGMPLTKEFRIFVLDKHPFYIAEYWEEGDYQNLSLPIDQFRDIMQLVESRFYTMDVAQKRDGQWIITELGDAQVAGLPEKANPHTFYEAIKAVDA